MEQRKRAPRRSHPATMKAAWALALGCAWLAQPVHARQTAAQQTAAQQVQAPQPGAREQGAATQRQTRRTDQANRAAAVEDETSAAAQAARTAQSETAQFETAQRRRDGGAGPGTNAAPSYGPVLTPRVPPGTDPARKDPAEVHDETDSLTRQEPAQPSRQPSARQPAQSQTPPPAVPRHPARQPAAAPMAPRPLRPAEASAGVPLPVPTPQPAPRPVRPGSSVIGSCQGNSCTDVNGNRYNGIGTGSAGVNSSGRLCTRTGVTVQCF